MANIEQYEKLTDIVLWWNERINVTAHRDRDTFMKKNVEDSLAVLDLPEFQKSKIVLDLGTGGGFPGLPLAIACPEKNFVLLDSTEKKLKVVSAAAEELGLNNVQVLNGRAEELAAFPEYRESFDVVVSRAVAAMPTLSEYCMPFVKVGGCFIAYKTAGALSEISSAENAIKTLGGEDIRITTPEDNIEGHILVIIKKEKKTPEKYPRVVGLPAKHPL